MAPIKSLLVAGLLGASTLALPIAQGTEKAADNVAICMIEPNLCKADPTVPVKAPADAAVCMIESNLCKGGAVIPAKPEPIVARGESKEKARKEAEKKTKEEHDKEKEKQDKEKEKNKKEEEKNRKVFLFGVTPFLSSGSHFLFQEADFEISTSWRERRKRGLRRRRRPRKEKQSSY